MQGVFLDFPLDWAVRLVVWYFKMYLRVGEFAYMVVCAIVPCKSLFLKDFRRLFSPFSVIPLFALCVWKIAREQIISNRKMLGFAQSIIGRTTTSLSLQHKLCPHVVLHPRTKKDAVPSCKISSVLWRVPDFYPKRNCCAFNYT